MLRLAATAAVIAILAVSGVADLKSLTAGIAATPSEPVEAAPTRSSGGARYGDLVIEADAQGHYRVEARISGQAVPMLVDTGATAVALRAGDARRLGIHPAPAEFDVPVQTANGTVKAARVVLPEVGVGPVRVRDVTALVLPDAVLGTNLLGMSFLGKARRFEVSGGRLVLAD